MLLYISPSVKLDKMCAFKKKKNCCSVKDFLSPMYHNNSQSSVNNLHKISYCRLCLVSMDDSHYSINTTLSAFLSPEATEILPGLNFFLFPLSFHIFLASHSEITYGSHQAI